MIYISHFMNIGQAQIKMLNRLDFMLKINVPHNLEPIPPENFWAAAWHHALAETIKCVI